MPGTTVPRPPGTVPGFLAWRAAIEPAHVTIEVRGADRLTLGDWDERAHSVAVGLRERGVRRGDLVLGQFLAAVVVPVPGATAPGEPNLSELRRFLATRRADYQLPARLVLRETLPHNAGGKVHKRQLAVELDLRIPS